ncbi:MAG: GNAT family N-acetyltransferase [Pseudomonas sp.]|jgi:predicted GNAT family N-acyltransferase|uniref:GNAT family N-acetyltransferase n=1 Tax=Pseudomonadaceae TaxID=135621 RepID=UPI00028E4F05|nr:MULTISPECIES: GNAT family N-acetyltransferase [Pseudomonadaceae]MDT3709608.1 GNAT family N-acetyltransferase [Pseudomonadaceae bacterium]EKM93563.1 acetyl transferase [Stutzerimonas degradans]KGK81599.1 GNAT family acetyltransferase [Stutzerimonas degradans]MCF6752326.1 GNAT family N-acetyltransferase [Stutzerimonas stutzeri]MCQ4234158.1 GNAT family N-acetyltransferase [Stutzerimonas degradans]
MNNIQVRIADWQKDNADLRRIREAVFIAEQAVPPEQEWDADDVEAVHFLALEDGYAIGTARLLADGQIGRVAVLRDWRGMNVGDALMQAVIAEAERRGLREQKLTAQVHATRFYERLGFEVVSEEFLEAGIPHVDMLRKSH